MSISAQSLSDPKKKAVDTAFVGRQPIFSADLEVFGYELLFRSGDGNSAVIRDGEGDQATASVLLNSLTDIGLDVVTDSKLAFINLTRNLVLNADLSCLPPDRIVLEVLEDIEPDEAVLAAIAELSADGYTIALDDFIYSPELEPLVKLADIVKIELPQIPHEVLPGHIARLRQLGVRTILAEKVETHEEFELCKQLGCDLFQGYFFCRPQILSRRKLQSNVGAVVRLVTALQNPAITTKELEEVIQTDANLSYKLLRLVNSVAAACCAEIDSLGHAIILLGRRRLRSIASMMLLASMNEDKPEELINTAMTRAKMCELLAKRAGHARPDRYFTLGLLSVLDAMLDLPMDDVIQLLPLSSEMNDALVHRDGQLGGILTHVLGVESGDDIAIDHADVGRVYAEVLQWKAKCSEASLTSSRRGKS